jgi:hypothetical protein
MAQHDKLTIEWLASCIYIVTECVGSLGLSSALSKSYRKTTEKVNVGEDLNHEVAVSL